MPKNKDASTVRSIFRQHTHYKEREYRRNPEIFPESEVRAFLGILDTSISCCDGIVERKKKSILPISKNKRKFDLMELKGKHLDTIHKDMGQSQMNSTIDHFKSDMVPFQGISFIKKGGWIHKAGYIWKKGYIYRMGKRFLNPETLKNGVPLRVKYYVNKKLIHEW